MLALVPPPKVVPVVLAFTNNYLLVDMKVVLLWNRQRGRLIFG